MAIAAETTPSESQPAAGGFALRRLRFGGLLLLLCIRSQALGCGQPTEFECEELAQHLIDCCGHAVGLKCEVVYEKRVSYSAGPGCGAGNSIDIRSVAPDVSGDAALCLRRASCEALQQAGACRISSWLGPIQCSSKTASDSAPFPYSGSSTYWVTECSTPRQTGRCETYRPVPTCQVFSSVDCAPVY